MATALGVFLITLLFIIWQPRGLQIGTSAIFGALVALLFGVVSVADVFVVTEIVWDATLSFIGIIILSLVLDAIGFFEWAALKMAKLSGGNGDKMFVYILILGALVAAFFANDGAALILTPILLAKMKYLKMNPLAIFAFLMAGGFIGDSASNPLIISNLTNIVTAGYFDIGFVEYLQNMFLPNMLSIFASIVVLWIYFRKDIPRVIDISKLPEASSVIKNQTMFRFSWIFLALLMGGYFIGDYFHMPVSVFALGGALLFLAIANHYKAVKPIETIKSAPWQVVWFSIGLYVVVYGLKNAGLTDVIASWIRELNSYGETIAIIGTGFLSAVISSVMNNMPTIMIMDIAIEQVGYLGNEALVYANILGSNLGPKMTPIGSLATLLWLHVLAQKGVKITWWEYMKVGLVITPPVLLVALLGLI
ncbi:MAG: arsenic transporter [Epsilonproteobacteria bacterium]|nr:arsenic transporter [Campylobacterota bacterium]OIO14605.1 MAG: arsenical efflux pump membrane protein ArsB [Helicobacteraceae bacterium CG1_02_36_14]PIP09561.1 MAG: arsenical efflux pump membrane protein ArsB [Sulfurimonas sp. CG23_combo_of_CG06-09_8_20_14_all_36_33]PIS25290.1 MAG: arsenical efflux pump membrane protein ArsB [Sulfurimonas sp. CG08_land_8_20_14_0_20_36_33]PIU33548.1 MAG: arsenical efflux pump membrane protein ArsB [Sulfurimonas sp. CG07_land_8_20_14_0_80_36_56]PIV04017.1 MA